MRPKDVASWIEQLPVASATESAKKLFRATQDLNRTRIPPGNRLQVMDLLTGPVDEVTRALGKRFVDVPLPLSDKVQRTAQMCIRLSEELAFGYKLTVTDLVKDKLGFQERKLLTTALVRVAQRLLEVAYQSALVYLPCPRLFWREMHNLFVFADTRQLAATPAKPRAGDNSPPATLRDTYQQILLFAASCPNRLRQRELAALRSSLPDWARHIRLGQWSDADKSPGSRFVAQLQRDAPPVNANLIAPPAAQPAVYIDTSDLLHVLRQMFDGLPSDADEAQSSIQQDLLPKSTLRRLIKALGTTPKRQFARTRLNFDLDLAVGLTAIYGLISGEPQSPKAVVANTEQDGGQGGDSYFASELLDNDSGLSLVPVDDSNLIYERGYQTFGPASSAEPAPQTDPPIWTSTVASEGEPPGTLGLRTLNESAGGYCIEWGVEGVPGVKIGELIGIQAPGGERRYGLAVVRWMGAEPGRGLNVGLQLIAPLAHAATATLAARRQRTPVRCLIVPELKSADRPASLITPATSVQVGNSLHIRHADGEQGVRLVRLLEATGAFAQFQFEYE